MISSMIVHPERFLTPFAPARISSQSHQDQARQKAKHTRVHRLSTFVFLSDLFLNLFLVHTSIGILQTHIHHFGGFPFSLKPISVFSPILCVNHNFKHATPLRFADNHRRWFTTGPRNHSTSDEQTIQFFSFFFISKFHSYSIRMYNHHRFLCK